MFSKIVLVIVGEYEQRAVYKRNNVVGNGPDSVLRLPMRFILIISKYNLVFYGHVHADLDNIIMSYCHWQSEKELGHAPQNRVRSLRL